MDYDMFGFDEAMFLAMMAENSKLPDEVFCNVTIEDDGNDDDDEINVFVNVIR